MPAKVSPSLKILTEMRDELKRGNSRLGVVEKRLEVVEKRLEVVEEGQKEIARPRTSVIPGSLRWS